MTYLDEARSRSQNRSQRLGSWWARLETSGRCPEGGTTCSRGRLEQNTRTQPMFWGRRITFYKMFSYTAAVNDLWWS